MSSGIYLDNSATTRPFDEVIEYMDYLNRDVYGNPSSLHTKGIQAEKLVKKARDTIAESIKVESREIYFTSGGTESDNLAIRGYLSANSRKGKHIITTKIEHPAVLEVFKHLEGRGYKVDFIDVDGNGIIDLESLKSKICSETALISVMHTNNEVGSIQPIDEVIKMKNSVNRETVIHIDAVQAYGKMPIYPKKAGIDLMSFSSHKIHGPKGVGALYVNRNIKLNSIIFGGGQETGVRSGTENVPGICGFGLASEKIHKNLTENLEKVNDLKVLFLEGLKGSVEEYSVISPAGSSPYILNISFNNLRAEVLLHHLEEKDIFVSTGSACSSRKNLHSHVLKAMGVDTCNIEGAIRFSFSCTNTRQEILDTLKALKEIVPKIQIKRGGRR